MKISEFYDAVAAKADTENQKINAADVRRVLACAFDELNDQSPSEMADTIANGLKASERRGS